MEPDPAQEQLSPRQSTGSETNEIEPATEMVIVNQFPITAALIRHTVRQLRKIVFQHRA
jgi:hypothetical protein